MSTSKSRALVLSGGGPAGGAWMLGLIRGLQDQGVDLTAADLIIGTSAGARAGAQIATNSVAEASRLYRGSALPTATVYATMPDFQAVVLPIIASAADQQEAARRIANLGPIGRLLASAEERAREIAAQLPVQVWPEKELLVTT
ncbi:MAG: patatin-like phospholipase family protein, partial [Nitrososphaerales archaeon]